MAAAAVASAGPHGLSLPGGHVKTLSEFAAQDDEGEEYPERYETLEADLSARVVTLRLATAQSAEAGDLERTKLFDTARDEVERRGRALNKLKGDLAAAQAREEWNLVSTIASALARCKKEALAVGDAALAHFSSGRADSPDSPLKPVGGPVGPTTSDGPVGGPISPFSSNEPLLAGGGRASPSDAGPQSPTHRPRSEFGRAVAAPSLERAASSLASTEIREDDTEIRTHAFTRRRLGSAGSSRRASQEELHAASRGGGGSRFRDELDAAGPSGSIGEAATAAAAARQLEAEVTSEANAHVSAAMARARALDDLTPEERVQRARDKAEAYARAQAIEDAARKAADSRKKHIGQITDQWENNCHCVVS